MYLEKLCKLVSTTCSEREKEQKRITKTEIKHIVTLGSKILMKAKFNLVYIETATLSIYMT